MILAAWYAIVCGAFMLILWGLLLLTGQVPNLESELFALAFHWGAELLTALALIAGGLGLWRARRWAAWAYPLALGMLLYSLINSPGFYAQRQEWGMVGLFATLLALTALALVAFVRDRSRAR